MESSADETVRVLAWRDNFAELFVIAEPPDFDFALAAVSSPDRGEQLAVVREDDRLRSAKVKCVFERGVIGIGI